jgi:hypothetical protein
VVSICQPEPLNLGGLFAARKIVDMIDAHYGVVAPHSAQGPVASAACVQLNACTPNFLIHEFFDDFNDSWEKHMVHFPVEVVDGYVMISDRPGLGTDLNLEEMAKHPYSHQFHLPLFKAGWENLRILNAIAAPLLTSLFALPGFARDDLPAAQRLRDDCRSAPPITKEFSLPAF